MLLSPRWRIAFTFLRVYVGWISRYGTKNTGSWQEKSQLDQCKISPNPFGLWFVYNFIVKWWADKGKSSKCGWNITLRGKKGSKPPTLLLSLPNWRITFSSSVYVFCDTWCWYCIDILKRKQWKHEGVRFTAFMLPDSTESKQSWTKTAADAFFTSCPWILMQMTFYGNSLNCSIASSPNCTLQDVRLSMQSLVLKEQSLTKRSLFSQRKFPKPLKFPLRLQNFYCQFYFFLSSIIILRIIFRGL